MTSVEAIAVSQGSSRNQAISPIVAPGCSNFNVIGNWFWGLYPNSLTLP